VCANSKKLANQHNKSSAQPKHTTKKFTFWKKNLVHIWILFLFSGRIDRDKHQQAGQPHHCYSASHMLMHVAHCGVTVVIKKAIHKNILERRIELAFLKIPKRCESFFDAPVDVHRIWQSGNIWRYVNAGGRPEMKIAPAKAPANTAKVPWTLELKRQFWVRGQHASFAQVTRLTP